MSNYSYSTGFFGGKDGLSTGSPDKEIKGADFETEFANIAIAVNSKLDAAAPVFTGNLSGPSATITNITATIQGGTF